MRNVGTFLLSAVIFLVLLFSIGKYYTQPKLPDEIEPPIIDGPSSSQSSVMSGSGSSSSSVTGPIVQTAELLGSPYIPSMNPFGEEYKNAPEVIIGGTFSGAQLVVKGEVIGDGARLLLFNFGSRSGIINGYRSAANRIGIAQTQKMGGLFNRDAPIIVSFDLMDVTLGSSRSDFERTGSPTNTFYFVQNNQAIDVLKILAIPFNENGGFGGGIIHSLSINYVCKTEDSCLIAACEPNEKATACIERYYNEKEALAWRKRTGI